MKQLTILFVLCFFAASSCKKKGSDGPTTDSTSSRTYFGDSIEIPGLVYPGGHTPLYLKTTNSGVYIQVDLGDTELITNIFRYQINKNLIVSSLPDSWMKHRSEELYHDWEPFHVYDENEHQLCVRYMELYTHGLYNKDAFGESKTVCTTPTVNGMYNTPCMKYDYSSPRRLWIFDWDSTLLLSPPYDFSSAAYNYVDATRKFFSNGVIGDRYYINFGDAFPDPYVTKRIWVMFTGDSLLRLDDDGTMKFFDFSSYHNPNILTPLSPKVAFPLDKFNTDVYFRYENKVFKIGPAGDVVLFYTINLAEIGGIYSGDFTVDDKYMYASDGYKKALGDMVHSAMSYFPPKPTSGNAYQLQLNIRQRTSFMLGPIEVSKNVEDPHIYAIDHNTLLIVPK